MKPLQVLADVKIRLLRSSQKLQAYHALIEARNIAIREDVAKGTPDDNTKMLGLLLGLSPQKIPTELDRRCLAISMKMDDAEALLSLVEEAETLMQQQDMPDPNWPKADTWELIRVQENNVPAYARDFEASEGIAMLYADWNERTAGLPANMFLRNADAMEAHAELVAEVNEPILTTIYRDSGPTPPEK